MYKQNPFRIPEIEFTSRIKLSYDWHDWSLLLKDRIAAFGFGGVKKSGSVLVPGPLSLQHGYKALTLWLTAGGNLWSRNSLYTLTSVTARSAPVPLKLRSLGKDRENSFILWWLSNEKKVKLENAMFSQFSQFFYFACVCYTLINMLG